MFKWKKGMLALNENGSLCIILEVPEKYLKRGLNAETPGLYGFRGFWYGRDRFNIKSYGKIEHLENLTFYRVNSTRMSNKKLRELGL